MTKDNALYARHAAELSDVKLRYVKIGCVLGAVLIMGGSSADFIVYPHMLVEFVLVRLFVAALMVCLYGLTFLKSAARYVDWLLFGILIVSNGMMCYFIYVTEGSQSPYYEALLITLLALCTLFPIGIKHGMVISSFTLVSYVITCLIHSKTAFDEVAFFNNLFFLVFAVLIALTSVHFNARHRFEQFLLKLKLEDNNVKLATLDELKTDVMANVSHELRTPLTLILGPIQELIGRYHSGNNLSLSLMEVIDTNARRLLRLVNDLLDVVRLDEGKYAIKKAHVNMNHFLAGLTDSISHMTAEKEITLTKKICDGSPIVDGDLHSLEKIFINLFSNAIKFTPEGGAITIKTSVTKKSFTASVIDTGIGIDTENLNKIFTRFTQVDGSSTRQHQGLGIGLALVKDLVEKMNGTIAVTSTKGQGSQFSITFPLADNQNSATISRNTLMRPDPVAPKRSEAHATPKVPTNSNLPPVLVVDDETDMREYLASLLADTYSLFEAADGPSGLQAAKDHHPHVMVLDLMLPGIDGLQICKLLKTDEATRNIKILLLTARIDETSKLKALEAGADDFLTKPFSATEVKTRIANLAVQARLERDLSAQYKEIQRALEMLKKTQGQLVQSEKLNALGVMSAGLLHEINNPLNFLSVGVQLLEAEEVIANDDDLVDILADISKGYGRISTIVNDLKGFAYRDKDELNSIFDLHQTLDHAVKFTASQFDKITFNVTTVTNAKILGKSNNLIQVLVNLLVNATHAVKSMPPGEKPTVELYTETSGENTLVVVKDNGHGMDADTLKNIFDPFFTTKEVGEGTGLGLSICHTIIEDHGGSIAVESEPGQGTTFTVTLPTAT